MYLCSTDEAGALFLLALCFLIAISQYIILSVEILIGNQGITTECIDLHNQSCGKKKSGQLLNLLCSVHTATIDVQQGHLLRPIYKYNSKRDLNLQNNTVRNQYRTCSTSDKNEPFIPKFKFIKYIPKIKFINLCVNWFSWIQT